MITQIQNKPNPKPDYAKIIFVGIPLSVILWGVSFITLAALTHNIDITTYGAIVLTTIFVVGYLLIVIRHATWFKATATDQTLYETKKGHIKVLTKNEIIYAGIAVIGMVCIAAVSEIHFHKPAMKTFRLLSPLLLVLYIIERILRRQKINTKSDNSNNKPS